MKKLTLERSFSAPIEKVWEALSGEDKLKKWWSPTGMESSHISVDFKKGGVFRYCHVAADGKSFGTRSLSNN